VCRRRYSGLVACRDYSAITGCSGTAPSSTEHRLSYSVTFNAVVCAVGVTGPPMNCLICKWLKSRITARQHFAPGSRLQNWRDAQANDILILGNDADPGTVRAAAQLSKTDPITAFSKFLVLAENGSAWSALQIGWAYSTGHGVDVNQAHAEYWYRHSAEGGCQKAQLRLGLIYMQRRDYVSAEKVFQTSLSEGFAPAKFYLAVAILMQGKSRDRRAVARRLLAEASLEGDPGAASTLVAFSARGRFGWRYVFPGIRTCIEVFAAAHAFEKGIDPKTSKASSPVHLPARYERLASSLLR